MELIDGYFLDLLLSYLYLIVHKSHYLFLFIYSRSVGIHYINQSYSRFHFHLKNFALDCLQSFTIQAIIES